MNEADLPSQAQLLGSTAAALLVAAVLTLTAVLPAELGVDPTGVGSALGLTAMGELKAGAAADGTYAARTETRTLVLRAGQGTEIKLEMRKGDVLRYRWTTDGELFFDFHGEPEGAGPDVFTSFEKGSKPSAEGTFEAPFTGVHGWYWKNRSAAPVHLELHAEGVFRGLNRL